MDSEASRGCVIRVRAASQAKKWRRGHTGPQYGAPRAGEGRNHVDTVGIFHFRGEIFGVERVADEPSFSSQPLNGRSAINTAPSSA